jgi:hypothetical protein
MEGDTGVQQARMLLEREGANQEIKAILDHAIKSRMLATLNTALAQAMQLGLVGAEVTKASELQVTHCPRHQKLICIRAYHF